MYWFLFAFVGLFWGLRVVGDGGRVVVGGVGGWVVVVVVVVVVRAVSAARARPRARARDARGSIQNARARGCACVRI